MLQCLLNILSLSFLEPKHKRLINLAELFGSLTSATFMKESTKSWALLNSATRSLQSPKRVLRTAAKGIKLAENATMILGTKLTACWSGTSYLQGHMGALVQVPVETNAQPVPPIIEVGGDQKHFNACFILEKDFLSLKTS